MVARRRFSPSLDGGGRRVASCWLIPRSGSTTCAAATPPSPGSLVEGEVWCHPFVIGELTCGQLDERLEILSLLSALPQVPPAAQEEVLAYVEVNGLAGKGIGWIDAHLLAAARLASVGLWTLDRPLAAMARQLGLRVRPDWKRVRIRKSHGRGRFGPPLRRVIRTRPHDWR